MSTPSSSPGRTLPRRRRSFRPTPVGWIGRTPASMPSSRTCRSVGSSKCRPSSTGAFFERLVGLRSQGVRRCYWTQAARRSSSSRAWRISAGRGPSAHLARDPNDGISILRAIAKITLRHWSNLHHIGRDKTLGCGLEMRAERRSQIPTVAPGPSPGRAHNRRRRGGQCVVGQAYQRNCHICRDGADRSLA